MELAYLKEVWSEMADKKMDTVYRKEVLAAVDIPSQGLVSKMRRNLLFELLIVLLCVAAISLFYFTAFDGKLKEVSWAYLLLAFAFTGYYYKKSNLLKAMQCPTCVVKQNLQKQLRTLQKYVRVYLIGGTALAPVVMLFFYLLLYYKNIVIFPSLRSVNGVPVFTLLYLLFTAIFTIIFYFANRWYVNRLYGRHIQKLRNLLTEIEAP
ncbi:MAG TPA: hypothetical protein VFV68_16330 [Agriterribacter sp.]|nr:hypothetical protein [Agriterribacter sp.]